MSNESDPPPLFYPIPYSIHLSKAPILFNTYFSLSLIYPIRSDILVALYFALCFKEHHHAIFIVLSWALVFIPRKVEEEEMGYLENARGGRRINVLFQEEFPGIEKSLWYPDDLWGLLVLDIWSC